MMAGCTERTSGFNSLPAFAGLSGSPDSESDVGTSTSGHCVDYSTERGCERAGARRSDQEHMHVFHQHRKSSKPAPCAVSC